MEVLKKLKIELKSILSNNSTPGYISEKKTKNCKLKYPSTVEQINCGIFIPWITIRNENKQSSLHIIIQLNFTNKILSKRSQTLKNSTYIKFKIQAKLNYYIQKHMLRGYKSIEKQGNDYHKLGQWLPLREGVVIRKGMREAFGSNDNILDLDGGYICIHTAVRLLS